MEIFCEMCNKKLGTLTNNPKVKGHIRIELAICDQCDNKLWEKAIKSRRNKNGK